MTDKVWVGTSTPGDWSVAANWSPIGVPITGDNVYLRNSVQDVNAGLAQSAVTLAKLVIEKSYTGNVGTTSVYLAIGATVVEIGQGTGFEESDGAGRIKLNLGVAAATVTIFSTGTSTDTELPPVRLLANHASTDIFIRSGEVGLAIEGATEVSTVRNVVVNDDGANRFASGDGVTMTQYTQYGGDNLLLDPPIVVISHGGNLAIEGNNVIGTLIVSDGTTVCNTIGTIITATAEGDGFIDLTRSADARTVTNLKRAGNGSVAWDNTVVTLTTAIVTSGVARISAA